MTATGFAAVRFGSRTKMRCADRLSGWRWRRAAASTTVSPGWTDSSAAAARTWSGCTRYCPRWQPRGPASHCGCCGPARQDLAALIAAGAIAGPAAELLARIIDTRLAFLICGGTGSGKTTLLSAALGAVDAGERIVCVEDAPELAPRHPHVVEPGCQGRQYRRVGQVTVRDLVRQALRMRPDRIVVGEVRGAEVVDLLTALNTGHDGGAGTVHANSPAEVPARLEALAGLGGLDRAALHSQLAAAVQVVLHVGRDPVGAGGSPRSRC